MKERRGESPAVLMMGERGPNPCVGGHLNEDRTKPLRYQEGIWQLTDARGISCGYVCDRCVEWKKSGYRPEIFQDGQYWCDEPVDEEDMW